MTRRIAFVALMVSIMAATSHGYVKLVSFTAVGGTNAALLHWSTSVENENLGFNIHRSSSGEGPYQQVNGQLIPGAGTSSVTHDYFYTDTLFGRGTRFFYKLEDVDVHGAASFHGPVEAEVTGVGDTQRPDLGKPTLENPRPCPAGDLVRARCKAFGKATVRLVSPSGRILWRHDLTADGEVEVTVPVRRLPIGVYLVKLSSGGGTASRRIVVLR
jgi:hypothetical protein